MATDKDFEDALFGADAPLNSESVDSGTDSAVAGTQLPSQTASVQTQETTGASQEGERREAETIEVIDRNQDTQVSDEVEVASPVGFDNSNPQVAFLLNQLAEARRAQSILAMQGSQPEKEVSIESLVPGWEGVKSADDIEAILSSPERFNNFFTEAIRKAVAYGREVNLREMPRVVTTLVKDRETRQAELAGWYSQNQDLLPLHEENAILATEIAGRNNQLSFSQILAEVGKIQRSKYSAVGIVGAQAPTTPFVPTPHTPYQPQTPPVNNMPAFATPRGTRAPAPRKMSQEEKDLAELLSFG